MYKDILSSFSHLEKLAIGLNKTADAVKSTLGPRGQTVMIQHNDGRVTVTKDGVTVANMITLRDNIENIGATLIKEVATKTVEGSGDGTTTATVLTQAIFNEGRKLIAAGVPPGEVKNKIDEGVSIVIEHLKERSVPVTSVEQLQHVAMIAANNDAQIGKLIGETFDKVGKTGIVTIEEGRNVTTEVKYMDGMQFDRGYESPHYITDHAKAECVLEDPLILMHDKKILSINDLMPLVSFCHENKKPLLIISDGLEGEAFATVVLNRLNHGLMICSVKAPLFGNWRRPVLDDLAIATDGKLISEEFGMRLENAFEQHGVAIFGRAERVVISGSRTIIYGFAGKPDKIFERVAMMKKQLETAEGYEKDQLQKRIARFTGGIAVISVGAPTEIEMKELKDRMDDALQATRAASDEGILPGGGIALLRASELVPNTIIGKAIQEPFNTIINNTGKSPEVIKIAINDGANAGYDAKHEVYVENMVDYGIIDPTKVVRLCLENAASLASTLLTSKTLVYNIGEDRENLPPASGRTFESLI